MPTCEERVDSLENILAQSILNNDNAQRRVEYEMSVFNEKMQALREESKEEMRVFREESKEDRRVFREKSEEDRRAFEEKSKEEMRVFREESEEDRRAFREKSEEDRRAFEEKSKEEMRVFREESKEDRRAFREKSEEDRRAFEEKMQAHIEEMREDRQAFKAEMKGLHEKSDREMQEFRIKMDSYKKEQEQEHKNMNKQWGGLAKKMGTIVEDIIAPAIRPAIKQYFNCEAIFVGERVLKRMAGDSFEVDLLSYCEDMAFVIEVKSTPQPHHVDEINEKIEQFYKYFPEHKDKKLIKIFASIVFPENVLHYASKKGLYAMAFREWEYVDILNFEEIQKGS